jgi:hypothetical protein
VFAQFLIVELVSCLLLILVGWVGDEIRAGWRQCGSVKPANCLRTGRPRHTWPFDDSEATWTELPCKH